MALRTAKTKNGIVRGLPSGIPTVTVFKSSGVMSSEK